MKIPFNKPYFDDRDQKAVSKALEEGHVTGDSFYGQKLAQKLQVILGVKYALPTPSCTAALELAILSLDIGAGDEVILPSFNFASGAVAILHSGARPVFADIEKETFCIDPKSIERAITPRTRAIMIVHYAGHSCDMSAILKLTRKYKLKIIEDAAHAIGGKYRNKSLGTIGDIGCFSFHGTKNIVTGEGGAFVTNDQKVFEKAEIMREKGTNRPAFLRGEADKYGLVSIGSSYLLGDILSALATSQLNKLEKITKLRRQHAKYLIGSLADLKAKINLPVTKSYADSCWHIFALLVDPAKRDQYIKELKIRGVDAAAHYLPLHSSPLGKKMGWDKKELPITDLVSASMIRLPLYPSLTKKELNYLSKIFHEVATKILQ